MVSWKTRGVHLPIVSHTGPHEVAPDERATLVQEQLVAMPADERAAMLGGVFGLMTKEQRSQLGEKLSLVSAVAARDGR